MLSPLWAVLWIACYTQEEIAAKVGTSEQPVKDDTWHKFDILSQYQALRDYKWVADNVELSRRHVKLKFGHHQEVAKLEPETPQRGQSCYHTFSS